MEFFNINLNQDEIYKLYEFKQKYEDKLIKNGVITEPQPLQKFIEGLQLNKYAFTDIEANKMIPFAKLDRDTIIYSNFYDKEFEDLFIDELTKVNFDILNLKPINGEKIYEEGSGIQYYFIINGKTFVS